MIYSKYLQIRQMLAWAVMGLSVLFVVIGSVCAEQSIGFVLKTEMFDDRYQNDGVSFRVLCYHDVRDNLRNTMQAWPQMGALDTYDLVQHFSWLKENGYHPVSLDAIIAARNGGPKLPPKAVLITFDDGYLSVYTRVFPLLKLYSYPAVIGLVGEWLEDTKDGMVFYGDLWMPRGHFVTWQQIREMEASGLVEVASHSYGLHKGETANPQTSQSPAAVTRIFNLNEKRYESDDEYFIRIRTDLEKNSALIATHTGRKPRAMIWPYGAYNMVAVKAAHAADMPITMTLEAGPNSPDHPLARIRRDMLFYNEKISDLKRNLRQPAEYDGVELPLNRVVGVDLNVLYDPDPIRQDINVGVLVERILKMRVNMVYLRATADLNGDGIVDALYFPNRHLPMRSDLLNRVAWQLRTRAALPPDYVRVYVSLPITEFELSEQKDDKIKDIYDDVGKNAPRVAGIIFDDSAPKLYEDAAEQVSINYFSHELAAIFKVHQPHALTVRKIRATLITKASADQKLSSVYTKLIQQYDFVMLSVEPESHKTKEADYYPDKLIDFVAQSPQGLRSTIFELQSIPPKLHKLLPTIELANGLRQLQLKGARNFGYFPDDALNDYPSIDVIRPLMSLKTNPGRIP